MSAQKSELHHWTPFTSLTTKSKKKFREKYSKWNNEDKRRFYLELLEQIQRAIVLGDEIHLENLSWFIACASLEGGDSLLRDCYQDDDNRIKNTNLIILSTRREKLKSLEYIFSEEKGTIFNLRENCGGKPTLPGDVDENNHTVFYYAMQKSGTTLLKTIMDEWPGEYLIKNPEELDELISKAYKELKLRNVSLSDEMDVFVISKLVDLRFFSNASSLQSGNRNPKDDIMERIDLLLDSFDHIIPEWFTYEEVDEELLVVGEFIAKNIHTLKYQLKSTYDRIPWEEMEFCLTIFIHKYMEPLETNLFYSSILNKTKMGMHLRNFSEALKAEKGCIQKTDIKALAKFPHPRKQREVVVSQIVRKFPKLKQLYSDYDEVRDFYSLELIKTYAHIATSTDATEKGQLVIMRALQVIGECLKITAESPKLSNPTREKLILALRPDTREVLKKLRDSLSKEHSLHLREQIREYGEHFFQNVRTDISKISSVITDILIRQKCEAIQNLWIKILGCETVGDFKKNFEIFHFSKTVSMGKEIEKVRSENFLQKQLYQLEKLISDCKSLISKSVKLQDADNKFKQILTAVHAKRQEYEELLNIFHRNFKLLEDVFFNFHTKVCTDDDGFEALKWLLSQATRDKIPDDTTEELQFVIFGCLKHIMQIVRPNVDITIFNKFMSFWDEIFFLMGIELNKTKWIEELRSTVSVDGKKHPLGDSERRDLMTIKLNLLSKVLKENKLFETTEFYQKDSKLRAVVDMLVLDIMSLLSKSNLTHNQFFLDSIYPLAVGKNMRNHLAHGNVLFNVLLPEDVQVLINARKILKTTIDTLMATKIDRVVRCDIYALKQTHNHNLFIVKGQKEFYNAITRSNLDDIKDLIKKGADVKGRNVKLWTAVHFASAHSDEQILEFFCDKHLNINARDINGQSPLHIAAAFGRKSAVQFFVKQRKISVDLTDDNGKTPLHVAAQNGQVKVIEILLNRNASTVLSDNVGRLMPIHYAFLNKHVEASVLLLKYMMKAKLHNDTEAFGGQTLLHIAAQKGSLELVETLIEKNFDMEPWNDMCCVPLHLAACCGHLMVVQRLLKCGANVNAKTIDNVTPLHYAVANRHVDTARMLLSNGADANAGNARFKTFKNCLQGSKITDYLLKKKTQVRPLSTLNRTPLHFAAKAGCVEAVKILLEYKASIDAADVHKFTPLHLAVSLGHIQVVKMLIDEGASVNSRNIFGSTPLHLAVSNGHLDIVQVFINDKKADINSEDSWGNTPLLLSIAYKHEQIAKLLIKKLDWSKGLHGMTPLQWAIEQNMSECFISEGIDMSQACNEDGRTALHGGVCSRNYKFVDYCIQKKCDVNARDQGGYTPLHLAAQLNEREIVTLLIDRGSKLDHEAIEGHVALDLAVINGHKETVAYLIEKGASMNNRTLFAAVLYDRLDILQILSRRHTFNVKTKFHDDITLLHVAVKNGSREISKVLLDEGAETDAKTSEKGYTPLHFAAIEGRRDIADLLLSHSACPNAASCDGSTPLHLAIRKGHTSVISVLLDKIVDTSAGNINLESAFELAVEVNNMEALTVLQSRKGIDTLNSEKGSRTLLHVASQKGRLEIVERLVCSGSRVRATDSDGSQPIHLASLNGHTNVITYLLDQGSRIGDQGTNKRTLLHYAAMGGHESTVKHIIHEGGVSPNCVDANGETPLHLASRNGHVRAIGTLLEHGAYYNVRNKASKTPLEETRCPQTVAILKSIDVLFEAVKTNNVCEVERIISEVESIIGEAERMIGKDAFLNAKCDKNMTPLLYAAWKGLNNVADNLLSGGADPNISGNHGFVPLHYASQLPHGDCIVRILLSKSAIYNSLSNDRKTPLDISDRGNNLLKTVEQIFKHVLKGKNSESKVLECLRKIRDIDELKAVVRARNRNGKSLVAVAICKGFSKMEELKDILLKEVSMLTENGEDLLSKGKYQDALPIFDKVLKKLYETDVLCSENPFVLDIQEKLAIIHMKHCDWNKALSILDNIKQVREKTLGGDNIYTLDTKYYIGVALKAKAMTQEALEISEEVHQKLKKHYDGQGRMITRSETVLAEIRSTSNPCEETLSSLKKLFETTQKGTESSLSIQLHIAKLCSKLRKHDEALNWYESVYKMSREMHGESHVLTLNALQDIARAFCDKKEWNAALPIYKKVFCAQKRVLGSTHPDTLATQYEIGNTFYYEGKLLGALIIYREGLEQRKEILGPQHPAVVDTQEKIDYIESSFSCEGDEGTYLMEQIKNLVS